VTVRTIMAALMARGWMLATAESCTGGMISATITDEPGSSNIFDRGFVTYSNAAKTEMLGVRPETLAAQGAVSEEVAREMAEGALARSAAGIAVSVTGIAGPGGSETKPEGRVCFAVATAEGTRSELVDFGPLGRHLVREATVAHALHMVLMVLEG
jgi:nicotinamide-nucleotide amidase